MPRQKTDIEWQERVKSLVQRNPRMGDKAVQRELEQQGKNMDPPRDDYPSERTIRRIREEFQARPEGERRQYELFSWPQAMERGDLPWEASPITLELLLHFSRYSWGRPSVRLATWFWRVSQAAMDAPFADRLLAAQRLARWEAWGGAPPDEKDQAQAFEYFFAYAPWRSEENARAYADAKGQGIPPLRSLALCREDAIYEAGTRWFEQVHLSDELKLSDEAVDSLTNFLGKQIQEEEHEGPHSQEG